MANITRVSPAEAKRLVDEDGYVYVDVRSVPEYEAGHPAGAANVPLLHAGPGGMTPNPDFLAVMSAAYPKDAKLVLGCRSGQRSLRAAEALAAAGYATLVDQRAGFDGARNAFGGIAEAGWAAEGLPVETNTAGGAYADVLKRTGALG
jgi:rhodanese-related sulfurtransferase